MKRGTALRHFTDSAIEYRPDLGTMTRAHHALCADGKRRNAFPGRTGGYRNPDDTVDAFVYVGRARVFGTVSVDPPGDPAATVRFVAHPEYQNHRLVQPKGSPP